MRGQRDARHVDSAYSEAARWLLRVPRGRASVAYQQAHDPLKGRVMVNGNVVPLDQRARDRERAPVLREVMGAVLRRTRLTQQRTLADVAQQAQVSMPYLSEIERGRKEASSEVLAAVCGALDLQLVDLVALTYRSLRGEQQRPLSVVRPEAATRTSASPQPVAGPPQQLSRRFDPHGSPVALAA